MGVYVEGAFSSASVARGWEISSQGGRKNLLDNAIPRIGATGYHGLDGADTSALSQVDDLLELPTPLQGYLTIAYTPDGWDHERVQRLQAFLTNPSETQEL